jgi:hypothetical protein
MREKYTLGIIQGGNFRSSAFFLTAPISFSVGVGAVKLKTRLKKLNGCQKSIFNTS